MTHLPYTDADLRAEAARQYAEVLRAPDRLEVGDEMRNTPIPSAVGGPNAEDGITWGHLPYDDFHDASREVHELLDDAPDLSRWAVDLAASHLTRTTELTWGHGSNWALAVQLAHRPRLSPDLHNELVTAIRGAVRLVLDNRSIDTPEIRQQAATEEATR
ncbi:hypothetical protein CLM62_12525 [Streptomyces sp. SA15]|uniref:hypothetical protein n=1 Tax=Streptomyces sp. SA15 TaxID=934019 RepID=UPI000BB08843|nr:hypothetical protein [Streptomyces sp. SA15]PAZ15616.1 hypothetical protein CLM62_12525 [Streptomyces sp. SA15]